MNSISNNQKTKLAVLMVALIAIVSNASVIGASMVRVTLKQDGEIVGHTLYSGQDGGEGTDSAVYWKLLDTPPMFGSDVTIEPDKKGGKVATLKGKIEVLITIRKRYLKGIAKTDRLKLIRDDGKSDSWYFPKAELKRILPLVKDTRKDGKEKEKKPSKKRPDLRAMLEKGRDAGEFPSGLVLRVHADVGESQASAEGKPASLKETWDFTSGQVHRVVGEWVDKKHVKRRTETRAFDSSTLCNDMLDGKIFAIADGDGEGEYTVFADTNYDIGSRDIEISMGDQILLTVGESCAAGGFAESDARAFSALYEKLAKQARAAFAPKPESKE